MKYDLQLHNFIWCCHNESSWAEGWLARKEKCRINKLLRTIAEFILNGE